MILLTICIIAFILSVLSIIWGTMKDLEGFQAVGWIVVLCDALFGFGLGCSLNPIYSTDVEVKYSFAKTESYVMVEYKDPDHRQPSSVIFTDTYTFNNINDSTRAFYREEYNVYGGNCGDSFFLQFKDEK